MVTPFQLEVREYVKAIVGGAIAALALLGGALGDGLSTQEVVSIAGAFLTGFLGTFYAPNKAPKGQAADPNLSQQSARGDRGDATLEYIGRILLVLGIVAIVLDLLLAQISGLVVPGCVAIFLGLVLMLLNGVRRVGR